MYIYNQVHLSRTSNICEQGKYAASEPKRCLPFVKTNTYCHLVVCFWKWIFSVKIQPSPQGTRYYISMLKPVYDLVSGQNCSMFWEREVLVILVVHPVREGSETFHSHPHWLVNEEASIPHPAPLCYSFEVTPEHTTHSPHSFLSFVLFCNIISHIRPMSSPLVNFFSHFLYFPLPFLHLFFLPPFLLWLGYRLLQWHWGRLCLQDGWQQGRSELPPVGSHHTQGQQPV